MGWKYARLGFGGLVKSTRAHVVGPVVIAQAPEPLRRLLDDPSSQSWVQGETVELLSQLLFDAGGPSAVEDVYFTHINHGVGGLLTPFVKVALSIAGNDPLAFLSRMNSTLRPVSQGLVANWVSTGRTEGRLSVSHGGRPPPPASVPSWVGIVRYGFSLCGRHDGFRCEPAPSDKADSIDYVIAWS